MNNDSDTTRNEQSQPRPVANADVLPASSQATQVQQPPESSKPKGFQENSSNQDKNAEEPPKPQENKAPKNKKPKLPVLAITIAILISTCLIGLAVYIQLSSQGSLNINDFVN